jgi:hypothetical protein
MLEAKKRDPTPLLSKAASVRDWVLQGMALQIRVGAASMHAAPDEDPMGTHGGGGGMRTHGDPMGTHGGAMGTHGDPGVHSAGGGSFSWGELCSWGDYIIAWA